MIRNKKDKKQAASNQKEYEPNNKLYIGLLSGAIVLTGLSLLFRDNNTIFNIWTSISCGGIASVIVAWLIDRANCKKEAIKTLANRETLLESFYRVFDVGLQTIICEVVERNHSTDSRKWYEWIDCACEQAKEDVHIISEVNLNLYLYYKRILNEGSAIKSQEATLLGSGIICSEDLRVLSIITAICEIGKMDYESKHEEGAYLLKNVQFFRLIRESIAAAPSLKKINDIMVEPTIYLLWKKVEEEKEKPEEKTSG